MIAQVIDPWQPYDSVGFNKHHPPIPELSEYGLTLISLCLLVWIFKRKK